MAWGVRARAACMPRGVCVRGVCLGGMHAWRGMCTWGGMPGGHACVPGGMHAMHAPLWADFLTHANENITSPQLPLRAAITGDRRDIVLKVHFLKISDNLGKNDKIQDIVGCL